MLLTMHVLDFSTELQNAEVFVTLLKCDSTDVLPANLKILGRNEGNTYSGVSLRYNYRWVEWAARIFQKEGY